MQTSEANWFLGDGSFTLTPSRRSSKSFHDINSRIHQKSCKTIISAWSTPTQAKLSFAGLVNSRKMISTGFNRNALPQFVGPTTITLQNLSLPRANNPS